MILVAEFLDDPSRRVIVEVDDRPVYIGRSPESDIGEKSGVALRIPWDDRLINRGHSVARREGKELLIETLSPLPGRREPNGFYRMAGSTQREPLHDPLRMVPGDSFVIGRQGRTVFRWLHGLEDLDNASQDSPKPRRENSDSDAGKRDDLAQLDEYTLRLQLRLLQRELPAQVLSGWTDERDLFIRAAAFLHGALPGQRGVAAAFLAIDDRAGSDEAKTFTLLSPDPNTRADFQPSLRLIDQLDEHSESHFWTPASHPEDFDPSTNSQRPVEWIAAVPVTAMDDDAAIYRDAEHRPVWLYVETAQANSESGRGRGEAFIPFLRLIAALVASLLSAREKQRIQDQMSAYFSPALRARMSDGDQRALEPAMTDCTVIFVDRRGSSRLMENARSDEEILGQLRDNQDIVGEITQTVFDHDGVITDFSGDGVLALWGWPTEGDSPNGHARTAVDAAAAIAARLAPRVEYDDEKGKLFSPIRIGVSTGRLAVGKTGPTQQLHLSVFGSVVNLGARLEKIAKDFQIPVLLSDETAQRLDRSHKGHLSLRRLCFIKPAGFEQSYPVHELVLPVELGGSGVTPADSLIYERALDAFVERRWKDARGLLAQLGEADRPARWLERRIKKFSQKPPPASWQGEIESLTK